jgi:hypothetical protein
MQTLIVSIPKLSLFKNEIMSKSLENLNLLSLAFKEERSVLR